MTIKTDVQKTTDWHLFCAAAGVVISLGTLIFGCFKSLSNDIHQMDQRLSKLQGAFEKRGRWESRHVAMVMEGS